MALNYDRITVNPVEEDNLLTQSTDAAATLTQSPEVVAAPLEIASDRYSMGIFTDGERPASWDPHEQETHRATSVDTEGVKPLRTTVRSRPSPVIPIMVIEPSDPSTTNWSTNGQLAYGTTGWSALVSASFWRERVRDLVGFDYCARVQTPGAGANEGVRAGTFNVYGSAPYTAGAWLKGNSGGEEVLLRLTEASGGSSATARRVVLTTSWQWYSVHTASWGSGTQGIVDVITPGTTAITFLVTGVMLTNSGTLGDLAPTYTNLCTNPSFENDTAGWALNGTGSFARSTTRAAVGAASGLLTKGANFTYAEMQAPVVGGQASRHSAWVYPSVTGTVNIAVRPNFGTGFLIHSFGGVLANTWTRLSWSFTPDVGATQAAFDIGWESADAPNGTTMFIDGVLNAVTPDDPGYFDGFTPGFRWSGVSHASTSYGPVDPEWAGTNLVPNPSFEVDTTRWEIAGGTGSITRDLSWSKSGSSSGRLQETQGGGLIMMRTDTTTRMPVTPGAWYAAQVTLNVASLPAAGPMQLDIFWLDGAGGAVGGSNRVSTSSTGITTLQLPPQQSPANAATAYIRLFIDSGLSGVMAVDMKVDAAMFTAVPNGSSSFPAYFDGDTPGYYWQTARGGSASSVARQQPEYFDGSWPGCTWITTPFASASRRPAPGGPRRDAIIADVERAVLRTQRRQAGTLRRVLPNGHQVTFDLIGASVTWDDTKDLPAGFARGTISFESQPFARSPELTTILDSFTTWRKQDYTADLGSLSDFTAGGQLVSSAAAVTAGDHAFVHTASQYDFYSGEIEMVFQPGGATTSGFKGGVLHRFDSANRLEAYVDDNGTNSRLRLDKVISGARTNLLSVNLITRIANGSAFTVRLRLQDNTSYLEYFTGGTPPGANVTPTLTASYALAAGQETDLFGILTANRAGFCFTPKNTGDIADNFKVSPYLGRERANPCLTYRVGGVPGTAPALARLTITEDSGNDQYNLLVGLMQQRNQDITADNALFYEAETRTWLNGATSTFGPNPAANYTTLGLGASPYSFDDYSQDTISRGDYTFDSGAGTMAVASGQLTPTSTATKMFHRTGLSNFDCQMTMVVITGASVAGAQEFWLNVKRLDGSNAIFGRIIFNGASSALQVGKLDAGVITSLAGSAAFTTNTATTYRLRARIAGNVLTCELFTSQPPAQGGTPAQTVTVTLAGADATKFGAGVAGNPGVRLAALAGTDYKFDDLLIEGNNVVRSNTLTTNYSGVISTQGGGGNQHTHVGDYQFIARVNVHTGAAASTIKVRLSWSTGDFRNWTSNDADAVSLSGSVVFDRGYQLVNLGQVHLPRGVNVPGGSGLAQWQGRIEAKSTSAAASDVIDVDCYYLIPVHEVAGTARAVQSFEVPTTFSARDEFNQTAGNLAGKTPPIGGAWAGAGVSATDIAVETTGKTAQRGPITDVAGTLLTQGRVDSVGSSLASQFVQVDVKMTGGSPASTYMAAVARYTDISNFLAVSWTPAAYTLASLRIDKWVAGGQSPVVSATSFASTLAAAATWYTLRLLVDSAGRILVWLFPQGGNPGNPLIATQDSTFATGGALASGKQGIACSDFGVTTTMNFDNFYSAPATVDAAVFGTRQAEWRPDRFHRLDLGGNFWVPETQFDGDYTKLLQRDNDEQVARLLVKGVRNEFTTQGDTGIDRIAAQPSITPRWSVISDA